MQIKKGFSLIEFILVIGIILMLLVFGIMTIFSDKAGGKGSSSLDNEVSHIDKALLMLSNKPLTMDNNDINTQILTKAGFKYNKSDRKFLGDFDNLISIVEFPSSGIKSTYNYDQYQEFKKIYENNEINNPYKMSSECEYYKMENCDITFTSKNIKF